MADGSDGTDVSPSPAAAEAAALGGGEIWGTLEELLLACAVSRHGTGSWDSVAMEVQTRSPLAARPGLTPTSCRLRFRQLHRRFSVAGDGGAAAAAAGEEEEEEDEEADGPDASAADGWMDELRRLRVAELRREVERCDLSIGTLQTKVKRLREDRERSIHGGGGGGGDGEAKQEAANGDELLSSEEPGRSCRESNSTDLKPPTRAGDHSVKEEEHEAAAGAKQQASGESVAASKESSDLRSSASLCRRRHRRCKPGGTDEDADGEEASAPPPLARSSSQLLAGLLDTFASRFASLLERLHECQESDAYRGAIRRHVDIEMVRRRLDAAAAGEGGGCRYYPAAELYRDLLLLCTNALVFFPRAGPEHGAAGEARALVFASLSLREPKQEPGAAVAAAAAAGSPPAEDARRVEGAGAGAGADIVGSLIEKGGKPLIVCRKRSSIAKAAAAARKEDTAAKAEVAEEGEGSDDGEKKVSVAAATDKAWGLRTKKGRGPGKNSGGGASRKLAKLSEATEAASEGGKKADKKSADAAAGGPAKKRNAVDFLKRLNQGSSPSNKKKKGSPMGTRKRATTVVAAATPEQPQKTRKGPGRKEAGRGGPKKGATKTATPKRSVGRPPSKRGAAAPTTPPPSKRAKVNRSEKTSTAKRGGRR
ncbi:uncharacterized protein LOC102706783 [Oryza brachyantha]|uniref:uncharacterized protein LOC102706783 n=1 Tax=Oryza brachyantha TaxID=4533 RepID=UPI001AD99CC7|nr:uncharacterized protein LOC102706783 [Oryza brachyantha]